MLRTLSILRFFGYPDLGSGLNVEDGIRFAASVMAAGLCCTIWLWIFGSVGFCVGLFIGRLHRLDGLRCCARYPSSGFSDFRCSGFGSGLNVEDRIRVAASVMARHRLYRVGILSAGDKMSLRNASAFGG
ncbi:MULTISPECIES: hypothetical protein [Pseudomonas]|uniref:hypothetical protein n=1 Tax=Pseudomonas TaxID=286 RepID=UPI003003220C